MPNKIFSKGLEEILGTAFGTVLGKKMGDTLGTKFIEQRQEQISTLFFGPKDEDERAFVEAIFVKVPEKAKAKGQDGKKLVGKILDLLSSMESELQDSFRQKNLQFKDGKDGKKEPDSDKTADVLIGIVEHIPSKDSEEWKEYRRVFNLMPGDLPFDPKGECERLEASLKAVHSAPATLSWGQRFNFLSMSHPNLELAKETTSRKPRIEKQNGASTRFRRAWQALLGR